MSDSFTSIGPQIRPGDLYVDSWDLQLVFDTEYDMLYYTKYLWLKYSLFVTLGKCIGVKKVCFQFWDLPA